MASNPQLQALLYNESQHAAETLQMKQVKTLFIHFNKSSIFSRRKNEPKFSFCVEINLTIFHSRACKNFVLDSFVNQYYRAGQRGRFFWELSIDLET
jgi:hypothetical protein